MLSYRYMVFDLDHCRMAVLIQDYLQISIIGMVYD